MVTPKQAWEVIREQAQKAALVVMAVLLMVLSLNFFVLFTWDAFIAPVFGLVQLSYTGALGLTTGIGLVLGGYLVLREDKRA